MAGRASRSTISRNPRSRPVVNGASLTRLMILPTSLARPGVLHQATRVIGASNKILFRICNGRRDETKSV